MANYKFVPRWRGGGDDRMINLAFEADPSASEGAVETAFDALWADLKQYYTDDVALDGYTWYEGVQILNNPIRRVWGDSFRIEDRNVLGTLGGVAQLPQQLAVVITFPMPLSAKRHRGRVYMPAPSVNSVAQSGHFIHHLQFAAAFETFFESCIDAAWTPVVVAVSTGSLALLPITSVKVDDSFDTQRRRKQEPITATSRVID